MHNVICYNLLIYFHSRIYVNIEFNENKLPILRFSYYFDMVIEKPTLKVILSFGIYTSDFKRY